MKHLFLLFLLLFIFCSNTQKTIKTKPVVFVSIAPQKFFVDKISGGLFECLVMVPPGTNAHSYEPRPSQMSQMSKALAYFSVGLEFEGAWLPKFAALSKTMRIVHTDSGVPKISAVDNCEEEAGHHEQIGQDPHIWLSPKLVKIQAASIVNELEQLDTAHAALYRTNYNAFINNIDSLDRNIRSLLPCDTLQVKRPKAFLVFHPTWGYFAKDYCLKQIAIEVDGKEPSPKTMKAIIDSARHYDIRAVFVQPEYSRKTAEVIAQEIGATVLDADALSFDWMNNLITVATRFKEK